MKPKSTIVLGFVIAVAIIVYIYMSGQRGRPPPADMLTVLSGFRDRMCACTTAACRDEVGQAMTAWTRTLAGAAPVPAEVSRFNEISNQMSACMTGSAAHGAAVRSGAAAVPPGAVVDLTFEYSTEKHGWLEAAIAEFHQVNPGIRVKLTGKGSLESASDILDGRSQPVLWSPADSLVANLLASDWQIKNHKPLFPATGEGAPQPLLLTPMVFVVWAERAKVLADPGAAGQLSWATIRKAVSSPKGWAGIGGKPTWGFVTLGHTDPTRSNSGLQTIALMGHEFFRTTAPLTIPQLTDTRFQDFVRDIERGVQKFESSTGTFMTDMIRFGPSKYDIAVVYESLAISQLENAQGRWGSLRIYYPPVTIWSDHPVVMLDGPWLTSAQKAVGAQLIAFLRTTKVQARALDFGFRPADTSVPMKPAGPDNPFTRSAQYGLSLELPPAAQPPDGATVRQMLLMWSRVVRPK